MSTKMPMSTESVQEVASIIGSNLRKLIRENGITQKHLAEQLGVAAATMTDYCNGKRVPQATFLVELRKHYGVDLNTFMTSDISTRITSCTPVEESLNDSLQNTCRKYCGLYYTYYLDTSKFKGRDTLTPAMSLLFGILYIYEDPSIFTGPRYNCAAVLGFTGLEEADALIQSLKEYSSSKEILSRIEKDCSKPTIPAGSQRSILSPRGASACLSYSSSAFPAIRSPCPRRRSSTPSFSTTRPSPSKTRSRKCSVSSACCT